MGIYDLLLDASTAVLVQLYKQCCYAVLSKIFYFNSSPEHPNHFSLAEFGIPHANDIDNETLVYLAFGALISDLYYFFMNMHVNHWY